MAVAVTAFLCLEKSSHFSSSQICKEISEALTLRDPLPVSQLVIVTSPGHGGPSALEQPNSMGSLPLPQFLYLLYCFLHKDH